MANDFPEPKEKQRVLTWVRDELAQYLRRERVVAGAGIRITQTTAGKTLSATNRIQKFGYRVTQTGDLELTISKGYAIEPAGSTTAEAETTLSISSTSGTHYVYRTYDNVTGFAAWQESTTEPDAADSDGLFILAEVTVASSVITEIFQHHLGEVISPSGGAGVPQGTIVPVELFGAAVTDYFDTDSAGDTDGAGIVGEIWEGWHLCNGNDGTTDLRGLAVIGAGTYASGSDEEISYSDNTVVGFVWHGDVIEDFHHGGNTYPNNHPLHDLKHKHTVQFSCRADQTISGGWLAPDSIVETSYPVIWEGSTNLPDYEGPITGDRFGHKGPWTAVGDDTIATDNRQPSRAKFFAVKM